MLREELKFTRSISRWTGILFGLALWLPIAVSGATPTLVPGTSVTISAPADFEASKNGTGYESSDGHASIQIFELAISYETLDRNQSDPALKARGNEVLSREEITVAGIRGRLIHLRRRTDDVPHDAWMLLLGDAKRSVKIVASYVSDSAPIHEASLKQALLAVDWDPSKEVDVHAGKHYTIRETEHLKIVSHANNVYLLTEEGTTTKLQPEDPVLIISESRDPREIADLETFATERLNQTKALRKIENVVGGPVTIGGYPAYELVADVRDQRSEIPAKLYQVLIYDGEKYYLLQGFVSELRSGGFLSEFREIAHSFEKVASNGP